MPALVRECRCLARCRVVVDDAPGVGGDLAKFRLTQFWDDARKGGW